MSTPPALPGGAAIVSLSSPERSEEDGKPVTRGWAEGTSECIVCCRKNKC